VIALGLLASVLLASLGLFTVGEKQLRSSRAASRALASARSILEETTAGSFAETWARLGLDGSASSYAIDTRTSPAASRWQEAIAAAIPEAHAVVFVEALAFGGAVEPLDRAMGLRVVVSVRWNEADRQRELRLGTVRF
jgi:hypothetical protein